MSTKYGVLHAHIGLALLIGTRVCDSACRALILAFVTAWTFPLIDCIGVLATNTLFALIAWLGYGCVSSLILHFRIELSSSSAVFTMILFTIKYGDRMRAWVDIGYTTSRDTC